jgi:uncharacterized repeat protein (TIGR01451 family)
MKAPAQPQTHQERRLATTMNQPVQAERYLGTDSPHQFLERTRGGGVAALQTVGNASGRFKAYEDFQIIRNGMFDNSEKARLAIRMDAAQAWSGTQTVQVAIEGTTAVVAANSSAAESVYRYEMPPGKPRLRIVKVASTGYAQPGEEVEFTLRFDNVGDQTIGNVTVVDSLTTRLQYVPNSAQCSLAANFLTQENEAESAVLRWEIKDPLKVGQGGVIRFKCRVR